MGSHGARRFKHVPTPGNIKDLDVRLSRIEGLTARLATMTPTEAQILDLQDDVTDLKDEKRALEATVARLKAEADEHIPLVRSWTLLVTGITFVAIFMGGIAIHRTGKSELWFDFLGYVFPIAAGWVAGLGLYTRRAMFFAFKTSVLFLGTGLCCYLQSKSVLNTAAIYSIGPVALLASILMVCFPGAKPSDKVDRAFEPVMPVAMGFCIVLAIFWLYFCLHGI
jgi:hypothetical protein